MLATNAIVAVLKLAAGAPRVHGNGFVQIDLGPRVRLHVWGDPRIPKQAVDVPIHDHSFGFVSYVLVGALENVVYEMCALDDPRLAQVTFPRVVVPHRATVRRGSDTALSPSGDPATKIFSSRRRIVRAGEHYEMRPADIHESIPHGVTVSIIFKDGPSLAQGGPAPLVYVPEGVEPDNVFDRHAVDQALLWRVVEDAFAKIDLGVAERRSALVGSTGR